MASRDNCSELGRLSGDLRAFAIHTEFEDAVLRGLTVLFQSQGNSLYVDCSHHSFSSLDTGRWENLLEWVSCVNFHWKHKCLILDFFELRKWTQGCYFCILSLQWTRSWGFDSVLIHVWFRKTPTEFGEKRWVIICHKNYSGYNVCYHHS